MLKLLKIYLSVHLIRMVNSNLTITPMNAAVVTGASTSLNCSSDDETNRLRWFHAVYPGNVEERIYSGEKLKDSLTYSELFKVIPGYNGTFNLNINTANESIAGTYTCEEPFEGIRMSAELIVLASDPSCDLSRRTDDSLFISLWCSVSFRGNWAPVMTWKNHRDGIISEGVTNSTQPNSMIMYTLKVSKEDFENSPSYECVTEFTTSMKPPTVNASNAPEYKSNCVVSTERFKGTDRSPATWFAVFICSFALLTFATIAICVYKMKSRVGQLTAVQSREAPYPSPEYIRMQRTEAPGSHSDTHDTNNPYYANLSMIYPPLTTLDRTRLGVLDFSGESPIYMNFQI